jgi:site-specific DNA recombinase
MPPKGQNILRKAVVYLRYSPRPQASEAKLAPQFADIRRYCKQKNRRIVAVFRDRQRSGMDHSRESMWLAVSSVKRGGVLVVRSIDRLARDPVLYYTIKKTLNNKGAHIETADGSSNDGSPENDLITGILASLAKYQRDLSAARTKAAMLRHQSNGRLMGLIAPYGMSKSGKKLVPNADEQRVIDRVVELRRAGRSIRAIERIVNEEGIRTREGKPFYKQLVVVILRRARAA